MAATTKQRMTFEQFLELADRAESRCEFVAGAMIEMPPESPINSLISLYLLAEFLKLVPLTQIRHKDTELEVSGTQRQIRLPDLMILSQELAQILQASGRGTIFQDMPPPLLIVEVVSPGKTNEERDYRYKRSEYAARGIAEYWIVDPGNAKITVLSLVAGLYESTEFKGNDRLISPLFPDWMLTSEQILTAGNSLA